MRLFIITVCTALAVLMGGCTHERFITDARHPEIAVSELGTVTYRGRIVDAEDLPGLLKDSGLKDLRIATITYKPDAYKSDLPLHYVGFPIPDKFVVGRGLDYDGYGRNLPDIYQLDTGV